MKYSTSKENHLKAIYQLQGQLNKVSTNKLATTLQTRPASVTDMLKKLQKQRLLKYEPYKGFRLSGEGNKVALQVIRKHRLWEYFLVNKLGFGWEEVHEIAEELEHISSQKLIDRLDEFLEFPKTDPHGDPIPDSKGNLTIPDQITLNTLRINQKATVTAISDHSAEMLEWMTHHGIALGTRLEIVHRFTLDRSLELKLPSGSRLTLSEPVAQRILVTHD